MTATSLLARYHRILTAVAAAGEGLGAAEIGKATELPRSTAHRLALALCEVGYLQQDQAAIFTLGSGLDEILTIRLLSAQKSRAILPVLHDLASEMRETAFLARRRLDKIEIVDALPAPDARQSYIHPGLGERPLDRCSSSKAILAFCDESEVANWLKGGGRDSAAPAQDMASFMRELSEVRANGYAVCDGEIDEGVFSIACPVFIEPFGAVYSIGVTGPAARLRSQLTQDIAQRVRRASERAAARLAADAVMRPAPENERKKQITEEDEP